MLCGRKTGVEKLLAEGMPRMLLHQPLGLPDRQMQMLGQILYMDILAVMNVEKIVDQNAVVVDVGGGENASRGYGQQKPNIVRQTGKVLIGNDQIKLLPVGVKKGRREGMVAGIRYLHDG